MWLNALKIAIIEKNSDSLNLLMKDLPVLESKEEIDSALCLLEEAKRVVGELRDETQASMIQMKKNINFLKSTQAPYTSKLDINS
ncbi:MAG: hypothetical protein COA30_00980 [Sulfurimonas sp.]|nr:MAG: hypothetical protein COA30_03660 [Sulfurimonas sp.]PHQ58177.1 MAG: hypothetical protein COA30_00980 [Sulfurimonas sp.]